MRTVSALLTGVVAASAATAMLLAPSLVGASSHREAPLISMDPNADLTDLYAFVSPDRPDTVTLIADVIPFEAAYGGPNYYRLADDVLYTINVDNNGDARPDITWQFRSHTRVLNGATFLYNGGPIGSVTDPNWNVQQTYDVSRTDWMDNGTSKTTVIGGALPTPPANIGPKSTPNYDMLAGLAVQNTQVLGTSSTYRCPSNSSSSSRWPARPYSESPVTQSSLTWSRTATFRISSAAIWGLVRKMTSSGIGTASRRTFTARVGLHHDSGRNSR